jgi:hypothetical protein
MEAETIARSMDEKERTGPAIGAVRPEHRALTE